jgi:hypothetical protein
MLVAVALFTLAFAGIALANSGSAGYNGCSINWSNSEVGTSLAAHTDEIENCARVRANIYYRNTGGSYVTTSTGWKIGSHSSSYATGEGVNSIHRADTDLSGAYGILYKSF